MSLYLFCAAYDVPKTANSGNFANAWNVQIYVAPSSQRRKVWLMPTTRVPCSNAAKMRNPLKLAGVPQTNEPISVASGLKFTIVRTCGEIGLLLFNKFFSGCRYVPF